MNDELLVIRHETIILKFLD